MATLMYTDDNGNDYSVDEFTELVAKITQLEAELRYYKALCKYQEEGVTGWRYIYISDETATELEEARKALEASDE